MSETKKSSEGLQNITQTKKKILDVAAGDLPKPLNLDEKKYLLSVERGDVANVRRVVQSALRSNYVNINCVDSLGRGALTLAIDNENLEMVELLIVMGVETKDALLEAINQEFVEAVDLLLEHEELIHKDGEPYSWQRVHVNTAQYAPEITPLILAAHKNNYEIIKILLDRGATLPQPHDVRCPCEECILRSSQDSLRHSLSRVSEYRALASPSLISLSSTDPLQTAFQLSWELRNLAFAENECKAEYLELRRRCQKFAVELLDQTRTSQELAIILNYDPESPPYKDGDHMKLKRLEMAIDYKQKMFVAHPNIQQLLASLWYEGVPGFRRKTNVEKVLTISRVGALFPVYCLMYMLFPHMQTAKIIRKPFMKFLIHASSYLFFLLVLILVSQRAEVQVIELFGTDNMKEALHESLRRQRGNTPSVLEVIVLVYVIGFIWEETREIFRDGIRGYLRNLWNFIDFSRNSIYVLVFVFRFVAYILQTNEIRKDSSAAFIPREKWEPFDPQLIAEGLFAAANIFSTLKLVHLFSINPHLGPLQISLGRMVIDIIKFFFIYTLVLFAFACGLNQLLWYYADLEKAECFSLPSGEADWDNADGSCMKWRRFENLFEASQSLFWASFGMVGLDSFELIGIKTYTRFWGLLMFGSYSVINVIVLLNLLIAMMSNSYAAITEQSDTEWKFARTKLWMSYFEESATLPPPFNFFPSIKNITKCFHTKSQRDIKREKTIRQKAEEDQANRYTNVMRSLVWRYVSTKAQKHEERAVTEDDINEVKTEVKAMRSELLEIFEKNGMDVSTADRKNKAVLGKKMKSWERRLMKDFNVSAPVEQPVERAAEGPLERFRRISKQVAAQSTSAKWSHVIKKTLEINSQIGRSRTRQSFKKQQNLLKAMEHAKRLIERSPLPPSSPTDSVELEMDPNRTLVQLLQDISEEITELSPHNTLNVTPNQKRGSLASLNGQLQAILSRQPSPNPSGHSRVPSPNNLVQKLKVSQSLDCSDASLVPAVIITDLEDHCPLKHSPGDTVKVIKRKAPKSEQDISVSRPAAPKIPSNGGMIPPPPTKEDAIKIPTLSMTPATPTMPSKPVSQTWTEINIEAAERLEDVVGVPERPPSHVSIDCPPSPRKEEPEQFQMTCEVKQPSSPVRMALGSDIACSSSTEKLITRRSSVYKALPPLSPGPLRPVNKIEDVKTVKRLARGGWL